MAQNAPRDEKWLLRELASLSRRVGALETAPRAGHTAVAAGGVVVQNGGGVFIYDGDPALGNLIVSIAAEAGTDAYANTYTRGLRVAGNASGDILIGPDNKPQVHINSGTNYGSIEFPSNLADEQGANGVFGQNQFDGTPSEQIILHATSGTHQNSFYFGRASLDLFSDSADGSIGPMAQFRIDGQDVADFWSDKIELKKVVTVTGDLAVSGVGKNMIAVKPSDTSRANTTTFTDDPALQLTLDANATYLMSSVLRYEADAASDFAMQWVGPAGASVVGAVTALLVSATSDTAVYIVGYVFDDLHAAGGRGAGNPRAMQFFGTVTTGATGGTMKLQWSQYVSGATPTILHAGSFLSLQRVA